jgi:hypothetical protein
LNQTFQFRIKTKTSPTPPPPQIPPPKKTFLKRKEKKRQLWATHGFPHDKEGTGKASRGRHGALSLCGMSACWMQLHVGWVARLGCGVHGCVGKWVSKFRNSKGQTEWGAPEGAPGTGCLQQLSQALKKTFKKKIRRKKEVSECPQLSHPPSPSGLWAQGL